MRPYSLDLRQRIIAALENGQTRREVAERFSLCVSTVGRLSNQWHEEHNLDPRPITGRPRAILGTEQQLLESLINTQKDPTLASLSKAIEEESGKKISPSALHRNIAWLGFSYKKNHELLPKEIPKSDSPSKRL